MCDLACVINSDVARIIAESKRAREAGDSHLAHGAAVGKQAPCRLASPGRGSLPNFVVALFPTAAPWASSFYISGSAPPRRQSAGPPHLRRAARQSFPPDSGGAAQLARGWLQACEAWQCQHVENVETPVPRLRRGLNDQRPLRGLEPFTSPRPNGGMA